MSGQDDIDPERRYTAPYSARHPIPTISKYREEKAARQENALKGDSESSEASTSADQLQRSDSCKTRTSQESLETAQGGVADDELRDEGGDLESAKDTSQTTTGAADPKQRRKDIKKSKKERAEREVTDPVTHLPVTIHDFTDQALKDVEIHDSPFAVSSRTRPGLNSNKSDKELIKEREAIQDGHNAMAQLFPPPDFDALREELAQISHRGVTVGLVGVVAIVVGAFTVDRSLLSVRESARLVDTTVRTALIASSAAAVWLSVFSVREWMSKKIHNVFQDEVWDAQRRQMIKSSKNHDTESTVWLNCLVGSVWPLINPDLFASLADTLEDVMQASLPKFIRMVSVEDIGQGSESLRILGIRWLPSGAASKTVGDDGSLKSTDNGSKSNTNLPSDQNQESATDRSGMEAEEGDFINLEIAFAYRTRSSSKSLKERTKDMHLYLAFYLPGNIKVPVWVDLQGIIGTMRMRLQLTPDPPFFALCTITFLGQPKVDLSCVPLSKRGLNIMDVPFISKFVQSAVDAAMAEYVAPKSLTLDLKNMLAGDDFKKDTAAVGVLMVNIKRGYDFKMGDSGVPLVKDGSADPYVSVGWAKFGKVLWTTRILQNEMEPVWDETFFALVSPDELNIDESLRIQLWDSDRLTADDDLGRIEVNLKDLMRNPESNGQVSNRKDGFKALKAGDGMPGRLEWSVGYFAKTELQQCQFDKQTHDPEVRSMDQLKAKVAQSCERKLRETMFKEGRKERDAEELEQQKRQELKMHQDAMMISAPAPDGYPSGVFSLQIHNITGLELEKLSKSKSSKEAVASDEEETGEGLPSSYCTVIINHHKTFKTRTKPQNAKPFFNAGCERFLRDWKDTEVYVTVRDARVHEEDPLLGIVHLPLGEIFKERAQVMGFWPISGGIGHGRIRLSMVWRSVQLQAPRNLLGWQYGTAEIQPTVTVLNSPQNLKSCKLKLRTGIGSGKFYPDQDGQTWRTKQGKSLALAVQSRYTSCLSIAFRDKSFFGDDTAAFSVIWLKDLVDDEETELEVPVWKGNFARATKCCLEECGERVATLKLKVTFWSGMGAAHSRWAAKDIHTRNVVEVIDAARDNLQTSNAEQKAGIVDESASSSSESDSSDEDIPDGSSANKQGPIDQIRDYKRRDKGLHRRHRGIMQWKGPRTAKWLKGKFEKIEDNITGVFEHSSKQPGIETEV